MFNVNLNSQKHSRITLGNIYSNNIKIRNDNYIIILFYFLDNMKKLTEKHIMRKIRILNMYLSSWDMQCQSTTTQSLFRSCTLKISSWLCRKAEATNSADSISNWTAKETWYQIDSHHQFWCFETKANNLYFLIFRFLCNYQMLLF